MSDTRLGEALVLVGGLLSITREHRCPFSAGLHLICFHYHIYFILIIKSQNFIFKEASEGGYKNWSTAKHKRALKTLSWHIYSLRASLFMSNSLEESKPDRNRNIEMSCQPLGLRDVA